MGDKEETKEESRLAGLLQSSAKPLGKRKLSGFLPKAATT